MSSAGTQAGPPAGGTLAVEKGKPQIQFSGKSGVSYFEQLMMKRHRYDPACLSRAAKHTHTQHKGIERIISHQRAITTGTYLLTRRVHFPTITFSTIWSS